jgi:membrane protein implicated in regulation of membrane protease activity
VVDPGQREVAAVTPRLKQIGKWALWGLALLGLVVLVLLYMLSRRRLRPVSGDPTGEQLKQAIQKASNEIATANAQASVEIAVARTQDAAVKQELQETLAVKDGAERRRRMASLGARVGL